MKKAYFLSPHLDDAVFSCGARILELQQQGYECTIITIFTEADIGPTTLSARAYLRQIGEKNSRKLFALRKYEETTTLQALNVKSVFVGKIDALWRKRSNLSKMQRLFGRFFPEILHTYPTFRFHVMRGVIAPDDQYLVKELSGFFKLHLPSKALIFCPLGIGNHVDHLITRKACETSGLVPIYWADIPYNIRDKNHEIDLDMKKFKKTRVTNQKLLRTKEQFCRLYKTQYARVFAQHRPETIPEVYFTNNV